MNRHERKKRSKEKLAEIEKNMMNTIVIFQKNLIKKYDMGKNAMFIPGEAPEQELQRNWGIYFRKLLREHPTESHMYKKAFLRMEEHSKENLQENINALEEEMKDQE